MLTLSLKCSGVKVISFQKNQNKSSSKIQVLKIKTCLGTLVT